MRSVTTLPISTSELLEEARHDLQVKTWLRDAVLAGDVDSSDPHKVEIRWRLAVAACLHLKRQLIVEKYAMRVEPVPSDQPRLGRQLEAIDLALGACGVSDRLVATDSTWLTGWWR